MHTADCSFTGGNSNLNSCKWISHQNKNLKSFPNFKKHCILTHSHQRPSRVYTESVCVCELAKLPICKQKHMLNYHHSISKSISRLRVCVCGVFCINFSIEGSQPYSEARFLNLFFRMHCMVYHAPPCVYVTILKTMDIVS